MKTKTTALAVLCLLALLAGATAQTNETKANPPGNYYSWQHPEWPPMPAPSSPTLKGLKCYRLNQTNLPPDSFLIDDREVAYPPSEEQSRRLLSYDVPFLVRHPDLIQNIIRIDEAKLKGGRADAKEADRIRSHMADYKLMLAMSVTNVPSPYSMPEELVMTAAVKIGERIRTNRQSVVDGIAENGVMLKWPESRLLLLEYSAHLAKAALASTNRAETANFFSFKDGVLSNR